MCKYEDPVTDYEDDVLTSSENFGRKRRTRWVPPAEILE